MKKESHLVNFMCTECYRLFKGLTTPRKPFDKTFIELVTLMTNHENPE